MRPRHKMAARRDPPRSSSEAAQLHLVARTDRLTVLENQMRSVFRELDVQLTRIAQIQFELDATRTAIAALAHKPARR
jgi:hypothetical protein